jgi:hypothetical protein
MRENLGGGKRRFIMRKREKDLLVCYIGDKRLATQVASCFLAKYPGIAIRTGSMTRGLALAGKVRFRAVVVVIYSGLTVVTGVVTSALVKLGYSSQNTFVFNADPTNRFKHQGLVEEYGRDELDSVIEAARQAAEDNADCHWLTRTTKPTFKSRFLAIGWVAKLARFMRLISRQ